MKKPNKPKTSGVYQAQASNVEVPKFSFRRGEKQSDRLYARAVISDSGKELYSFKIDYNSLVPTQTGGFVTFKTWHTQTAVQVPLMRTLFIFEPEDETLLAEFQSKDQIYP